MWVFLSTDLSGHCLRKVIYSGTPQEIFRFFIDDMYQIFLFLSGMNVIKLQLLDGFNMGSVKKNSYFNLQNLPMK